MNQWNLLIPVLLPILLGSLVPMLKIFEERKVREIYITVCLVAELITVFWFMGEKGSQAELFFLVDKIPVLLAVDELSVFFSGIIVIIWLFAGIFALEYMKHEGDERRYYAFYLIAEGILIGLSYAGNLLTLYLCFECMTLFTMPLVLHSKTKEAVRAARKYMFYSIFGASASLGGIAILAVYAPSITFQAGGVFTSESFWAQGPMYLIAAMLMILGFCGKAGLFPLHGWLPTAHPQAPAPASAVMSGIITKMGVLACMRTVFYIFGADFLRGTWVQTLWMGLALVTIFMGSMMAYKEPLMKRRFAYSTVSQVSYILLGLSTMTVIGITGALLQIVFHAVAKTALFLMSGAVIYETGKVRIRELGGIGRQMPAVMTGFTLASLSLVGIPPLAGFVSKEWLAHGAMEANVMGLYWAGPLILLISAVLTAGYLLFISVDAWKQTGKTVKKQRNRKLSIPVFVLGVLTVLLGIFPGRLIGITEQIAHMLIG
jgi:multicomponent Na+:H+ antiporter subunit D